MQTFDAAFQSRIHISIEYKELDATSRKAVWTTFLEQHNIAQAAARDKPPKGLVSAAKSAATETTDGAPSTDEKVEKEAAELHRKRTMAHAMTQKDIDKLSEHPVNGRQIKNLLKNAQSIACQKGEGLSHKHVKMVLDSTQHLLGTSQESERNRMSWFA